MLKYRDVTPEAKKLEMALDNTNLSPLKKKIVKETVIKYDAALCALGQ